MLPQPTTLKAPFLEQFTDDWEARWKPSTAKKDTAGDEEEWAYVGEWAVEEPSVFKGMEGDKGLVVKNPAAHHAISAKFPEKIDNTDKTLVVQYEVKMQSEYPSHIVPITFLRSSLLIEQLHYRGPRLWWRVHEVAAR